MIKRYTFLAFKIIVTFIIVFYLISRGRLNLKNLFFFFRVENVGFFFLSGIAFIISHLLAAGRLKFFLKMIDMDVSFIKLFKLTMVGNFFNMVIPGTVGGDVVKGAYLFRTEEERRGRSAGVLMMDRLMGLFALLFLGVSALVYLSMTEGYIFTRYINEFKILLFITGLASIMLSILILFGKKNMFRIFIKRMADKILKGTILYRLVEAIGSLTKKRRTLVYTFFISVVIQLFALSGLLVLVNVINEKLPGIVILGAISSIIIILGIVPLTPGNVGWTELLASIGWSTVGSVSGAEVFLLWRFVTVIFSMPGMFFYFTAQKDFPAIINHHEVESLERR